MNNYEMAPINIEMNLQDGNAMYLSGSSINPQDQDIRMRVGTFNGRTCIYFEKWNESSSTWNNLVKFTD